MAAKKKETEVEATEAETTTPTVKLSRVELLRKKLEEAEQAEAVAAESRKQAIQERHIARLSKSSVRLHNLKQRAYALATLVEEAQAEYDQLVEEGKELGVEVTPDPEPAEDTPAEDTGSTEDTPAEDTESTED